jgi:hypothetical protein
MTPVYFHTSTHLVRIDTASTVRVDGVKINVMHDRLSTDLVFATTTDAQEAFNSIKKSVDEAVQRS